jgi:hypothetical protein
MTDLYLVKGGIMIMFRNCTVRFSIAAILLSLFLPVSGALAEVGVRSAAAAVTPAAEAGLIDPLDNFSHIQQQSNIYIESGNPSYYGGDTARMVRSTIADGYIVYKTDFAMDSVTAYSYFFTGITIVPHRMSVSADGVNYTELTPAVYSSGKPLANWQLYAFEASQLPEGTHYLKIEFSGNEKSWTPQLSKVVINQNTLSVSANPSTGVIGAEPLTVELHTDTEGASIFYKTGDDASFLPYSAPLSLTKFTMLDTYAVKEGMEQSPLRTFTYFAKADMIIDKYGQVVSADFPTKVTSEQQLQDDVQRDAEYYGSLQRPSDFDEYGGLKGSKNSMQLKAKGFFNIQRVSDKPVMVTPSGSAYFSLGVNGITNNETFTKVGGREQNFEWIPSYDSEYQEAFTGSKDNFSFYMANKYRKSGAMPDFNKFYAEAVDRLKKWGFNSAGAWGSGSLAKANNLPYTLVLPLNGMPKPSEIKIFDIFAADAESKINDAFSKSLPALKDDPLLIGYFIDNEYQYQKFMSTVPKLKASTTGLKARLVQMLQDKYDEIDEFNKSWNTDFASFTDLNEAALYIDTAAASADVENFFRLYLDTYYKTVTRLFRKYDPNHMLLGDRWLTLPMQSTKVRGLLAKAAGKYMDVISINHYGRNLDKEMLNDIYTKSGGKPILLSEYSYGTAEQGLAPIVLDSTANEQERQWRYRNYVEGALSLGYIVGTHWFDYVDQPATGRYFEGLKGEHYNTGLINVADRPYKTFLEGVTQTHANVYKVLFGGQAPFYHDFGDSGPGSGPDDRSIEIPYTAVPIPIDGVVNGFEGNAGTATLTAADLVSGSGGEGISADYQYAWDENKLYVTAYVKEPTPMMNNFQDSNIWKGDGVEMFFGPDDLELEGDLQYNDRQLIMSAGVVNGTNYWLWFNSGRQPPIEMAVSKAGDGGGYVLEAAIPWEAVNILPKEGTEFLFDFGFDDSEDGNSRKRQWVWNGTNRDNLDRGLWGRAKLVGAAGSN